MERKTADDELDKAYLEVTASYEAMARRLTELEHLRLMDRLRKLGREIAALAAEAPNVSLLDGEGMCHCASAICRDLAEAKKACES